MPQYNPVHLVQMYCVVICLGTMALNADIQHNLFIKARLRSKI